MPSIYVASLSDYNAGRLHGSWIELDSDTDENDIWEGVRDMLAASPNAGAEEFAIHDYDGFGSFRLSEWEPLDHVAFLGQLIAQYGAEPVVAYATDVTGAGYPFSESDFCESYMGEYDSEENFARALLIDNGLGYRSVTSDQLEELAPVIDWDIVADELSDTYSYVRNGPSVLVFTRT